MSIANNPSRILTLLSQTSDEQKLAGIILWIKQSKDQHNDQSNNQSVTVESSGASSTSQLSAQQILDAVGVPFIDRLLQSNYQQNDESKESRLRALFVKVGVPFIDRSNEQSHQSASYLLALYLIDLLSKCSVNGLEHFINQLIGQAVHDNNDQQFMQYISRIVQQIVTSSHNQQSNNQISQLSSTLTAVSIDGLECDEPLKQLASSLSITSPMIPVFDQLVDQSSVACIDRVRDSICDSLINLSIADPEEPSLIPIQSINHVLRRLLIGSAYIVQQINQSINQPPLPHWVYTARTVVSNALRSRLPQQSRSDCFELIDHLIQLCGPYLFSVPLSSTKLPYSLTVDEQFLLTMLAAIRVEIPLLMLDAPNLSSASISTLHSTLSIIRHLIELATSTDDAMPAWSFRAVEQLQLALKASAESIIIYLQHSEFETNVINQSVLDCIHFIAVWIREDGTTLRDELTPRLPYLLRTCGEESLIPFAEALTCRLDEPEVLEAVTQTKVLHRYASFFNYDAIESVLMLHESDNASNTITSYSLIAHVVHECGVVSDLLCAVTSKTTGVNRSAVVVELAGSYLPSMLRSSTTFVETTHRTSASTLIDGCVRSVTLVMTLLGFAQEAHITMQDQNVLNHFLKAVLDLSTLVLSSSDVDEDTSLAMFRSIAATVKCHPSVKAQLADRLRSTPIKPPEVTNRLGKAVQIVTKVINS